MSGKITKKDIAPHSHAPHGGSKDTNEHNAGNRDEKTLRRLNAQKDNAEKKRAADAGKKAGK